MITELLGGSRNINFIEGDKSKFSTLTCGGIPDGIPSPSLPAASTPAASAAGTDTARKNHLRCPRCDSSNTKFCYYNNYNLTQPHHFCKTCRRYWTKGGALRNVPVGGGFRKNRRSSGTIGTAVGKSSAVGKLRTVSTQGIGKSAGFFSGSDHAVIWGASSQNSHFLSLVRGNPNPSLIPNLGSSKDEVTLVGSSNSSKVRLSARVMGLDLLAGQKLHRTSMAALSNPSQGNQTQGSAIPAGLQELYQNLESSAYREHSPLIIGNVASANSSMASSVILESSPVGEDDQLGLICSPDYLSWPGTLSKATNGECLLNYES